MNKDILRMICFLFLPRMISIFIMRQQGILQMTLWARIVLIIVNYVFYLNHE